ncbi:MAG: asparagine synthase (glutamine-hydrolyzing) [Planctomycetes bacterium]|nr:asparagine synthase (glutamine-hydrolyzing) [Planctomycetota bacterium]
MDYSLREYHDAVCGIAGIYGTDAPLDEVGGMVRAMVHRGPDDSGIFFRPEAGLALGHQRLSIVDLSELGHQPMISADKRYVLVYNGEVYNHVELRSELEAMGHPFRSRSDTEVVLEAYKAWGAGCLRRFRGMFALAIWDDLERRLFLARDPFGIKPLLYCQRDGCFAFASELKGLLCASVVKRQIDYNALDEYLSFHSVPAPLTMVDRVRSLEPGHWMEVSEGAIRRKHCYWHLDLQPLTAPSRIGVRDYPARVRELLEESVRLRMRSDVPVAVFLSGGLDSAAVAALMSQSGARIKSFSIGFSEDPRLDECADARLTAELLGTDHHEVRITAADFEEVIDEFIDAIDQPSGDGLNTFLVSRFASREVKVAMSGLGGDELFGGYAPFRHYWGVWRYKHSPIRPFWQALARLHPHLPERLKYRPALAPLRYWYGAPVDHYRVLRRLFRDEEKAALLRSDFLPTRLPPPSWWAGQVHPELVSQLTLHETSGYMHHTLLRDCDSVSMHHSLELRVPLIDAPLAECVWRAPSALKMRSGSCNKPLLVDAVRDLIHPRLLGRAKRGFEMPVGAWLLAKGMDRLEGLRHSPLFESEAVGDCLAAFRKNPRHYLPVWSLYVLDAWCRRNGVL